ncbi:MAG: glycosyltransferase family 25 protein [Salinarimonas sp.]|nr:glycosyltransferase family 25 protein [Salinarimonas sp.]
MKRQLDPLGANWSFFDAWRHAPPGLPVGRMIDRELTQGELGCFSSHYVAWQWFVEQSEADQLVILEDDTVLDPDFFLAIDEWTHALEQVDMVRLYGQKFRRWSRLRRIRNKRLVRYFEAPTGTQAYILTRRGAMRLLRSIKRIERPIDDELNRFWAHGVLPMALFPYPVIECCGPSSATMGDRRRGQMTPGVALQYHAHRLAEDLRRLACNIRLAVTQHRLSD